MAKYKGQKRNKILRDGKFRQKEIKERETAL